MYIVSGALHRVPNSLSIHLLGGCKTRRSYPWCGEEIYPSSSRSSQNPLEGPIQDTYLN